MKKNTKQTKDDKMKKPKQHPKPKGFRMGLRAKIIMAQLSRQKSEIFIMN